MPPTPPASAALRVAPILIASFWMSVPASAVEWYLETRDAPERADAALVEGVAAAAGFDARVVRRFVEGDGWGYLARIDGFADGASARAAAGQLAEATGSSFVVLSLDGEEVSVVGRVEEGASAAPGEPSDAAEILDAVAAAHGTGSATLDALEKRPVRFRYRRTLADGRGVDHLWAREGRGLFLEVTAMSGPSGTGAIRPSRTRVGSGWAELSLGGAPWTPQDPEKARAAVEALGPSELLPLVLAVGAVFDERKEFERMVVASSGSGATVLRFGGDSTTGPIELGLDPERRIRWIRFDDGAVVREFGDYRPIDGLRGAILPWEIVTSRGGAEVDRLKIEAFEIGADLPAEWFTRTR